MIIIIFFPGILNIPLLPQPGKRRRKTTESIWISLSAVLSGFEEVRGVSLAQPMKSYPTYANRIRQVNCWNVMECTLSWLEFSACSSAAMPLKTRQTLQKLIVSPVLLPSYFQMQPFKLKTRNINHANCGYR